MNIASAQRDHVDFNGFEIPASLLGPSGATRDFRDHNFGYLRALEGYGSLQTASAVLDVGCGFGALALALFPEARRTLTYLGLGTDDAGIAWEQNHITMRSSNFQFRPLGDELNLDLQVADFSHDIICLRTLGTHLKPEVMIRALKTCQKALRPGGRVVLSMYLHEPQEADLSPSRTPAKPDFAHALGRGVFVEDPKNPNGPIAYVARRFSTLARHARLVPARFLRGTWSGTGANNIDGPDMVVLIKPAF